VKRLEERAAAIGRAAQERALVRIEQALRERHIQAELRDGAVVLSGQRLVQRWLRDSSLRFVTGLMR
jgi:hypothetical protein